MSSAHTVRDLSQDAMIRNAFSSYSAPCSLPLSAGLSVVVSLFDTAAAPNPFRCDLIAPCHAVWTHLHPSLHLRDADVDPRFYSFLSLTAYRLLRYLIPPTDAVRAAAAPDDSAREPPPSACPASDVALAAMEARVRELYPPSELGDRAVRHCGADEANFMTAEAVQPLLSIDAASDESDLSAWQRWLIRGDAWQRLAGALLTLLLAELLQMIGELMQEMKEQLTDTSQTTRPPPPWSVCFIYKRVFAEDADLYQLWLNIGMPAYYPPQAATDFPTAYQRQFEQQMRAAVAVSAPWMLDAQQVRQRVADWMDGRLAGGDAVFFRRYHVRPLWHEGASDIVAPEPGRRWDMHRYNWFPMRAGFELVDAAGGLCSLVVESRLDSLRATARRVRSLDMSVSERGCLPLLRSKGSAGGLDSRDGCHILTQTQQHDQQPFTYQPLELFYCTRLPSHGQERGQARPGSLDDYVCHGHLHGLSERQWDEAMGGRLRVGYYSGDEAESKLEQADDEQAAVSKDSMFPARLADVADMERYRRLQRTEIRRMAAIASRLVVLDDAGVDPAVFPCFQPASMRRAFEHVLQTRLETEVAGLPAALPPVLQGVVMDYHPPQLDIPL